MGEPGGVIPVEVCYAGPESAEILLVKARPGWTIRNAIDASGILARYPIDLDANRVGVFGKLKSLDTRVAPGDRIEIYRSLTVDANTARLRRFEKSRSGKAK